jgi:hypothetical protein
LFGLATTSDVFGAERICLMTQRWNFVGGLRCYHISSSIVSPKPSGGDDRILIRHLQDQSILVLLADGATGVGFGAIAAQCFIEVMSDHVTNFNRASADIAHGFRCADSQIAQLAHQCDTTGVVLLVNSDHYMCASVGDSSAFVEASSRVVELILGQRRKPPIEEAGCAAVLQEWGCSLISEVIGPDGLARWDMPELRGRELGW